MKTKYIKLSLILAGALLCCSQVKAETSDVDKFKVSSKVRGCEIDMKQHCQDVTPGNNREILCLMAHENKLLDSCRIGLAESAMAVQLGVATLDYAHEECGADRMKLCSKVEAGNGQLVQCFRDNKDKVSANCKNALEKVGLWDAAIEPAAGN